MKIVFIQNIIDFFCGKKNKNVFDYGVNNKILFTSDKNKKKIKIHIYGNNNYIEVKTIERCIMDIYIGLSDCPVNNCKLVIEPQTSIAGMEVRMCEDNLNIHIGKDCMISDYIKLFCSDMHTIFNYEEKVVNIGKQIFIGNHVWIGTGVSIAKNSHIADNCIVGMKSVVAGKYEEPNCVIAGNPARVVKHNVNWDRLPIPKFELKSKDQ